MKNVLVVTAEDLVVRYQAAMMDFLNDTQGDLSIDDFAEDLIRLGKTLQALDSPFSQVALPAFKGEFSAGSTIMMLSSKEFDQLEAWSVAEEDFQIAIFREDGSPVGVIKKSETNW